MFIFRLLVLVALIRLLIATDNPLLCAGIYTGVVGVGSFLSGAGPVDALLASGLALLTSGIYFWLLKRFDGSFLWWVIMIAGVVIGFV